MTSPVTHASPMRRAPAVAWVITLLALVILPAAVLWPARTAGPVADDFFFLSSVDRSSVGPAFVSGWGHVMGRSSGLRPMTLLSYAIDHAIHPQDPAGYRLTNFLLHGVNAALVALVLSALSIGRPAAAIAGILFALHPAHHENVVWIAGRPFMVGTLFGLLALWSAFSSTAGADRPAGWRGALRHTLTAALALASLLSYEGMIVLAPLAAAMAACSPRVTTRDIAKACVPLIAATGLYLFWRFVLVSGVEKDLSYLVQSGSMGAAGNLRDASVRVLACGGCNQFLRAPWISVTFLVTLAGVAAASLVIVDRVRVIGAACAIGLIGFLPFLAAGGYTDRFLYLSTLAPVIVLGLGVGRLRARTPRASLLGVAAVAVIALLWSRQLGVLARDWVVAGDLAREMIQRLPARVEPLASTSQLFVFDLPSMTGGATVFPTYFSLAVQQHFDRPTLPIYECGSSSEPGAIDRVLAARSPDDFVLRWVDDKHDWELIAGPTKPAGP